MVYIVTDGTGYAKIGVAANIKERIKGLQVGNPRRITKLKTIETRSRYKDFELEKGLHERYKDARVLVNGVATEWFEIDKISDLLRGGQWRTQSIAYECGDVRIHKVTNYANTKGTPLSVLSEYLDCKTMNAIKHAGINSVEELKEFVQENENYVGYGIPGIAEKRASYIRKALQKQQKTCP